MGGITVISTMKNEGAFLLEWLAHYRVLGADRFFIAHNDCEDPQPAMLARLEAMGLVRAHATKHTQHGGIQRAALRQARWYEEVTGAEWLWVCDADEFLVVKVGDGTFRALIAATPGVDVIGVNWRIFGSNGVTDYDPAPVTQQFPRCEAPPRAAYVKSLFRRLPDMARIGVHQPEPREGVEIPHAIAGGRAWQNGRGRLILKADYAVAQVNHYALRSRASFLVKRDRGRVNHANEDMAEDYWRRFEKNAVEDTAIRRYDAAVAAELAALRADAELAALEAQAREWHRGRIAALMARPDWAEFAARLQTEG
ncbi:MAG: glycosyltransferase family 2 protein [Paenirhodobacter sp.]|uniref:glycosyltransferase family 2 protein n=1 Tax=Paenirhodobacter sp. TaxID=1965326 RepID=UPI003D0B625E